MTENKSVGIWIRVSTDFQAESDSPEHHEIRARAYATAKGWQVAEIYRLEAVSGKFVKEHPEAKRMLKDIQSGRISGLIFSKLARLARNTRELLEFAEIFGSYGADLISLSESIDTSTPAGRLFYTMIAAMAEWERAEISERVSASVPIRAKLGKPLGGIPIYGYKWVDKQLQINETEALVRKLVYELFLEHQRKKHVAKLLNEMGYRTRSGAKFTGKSIHRLVSDPSAKGVRIANFTDNNKKLKPQSEWVYVPCPAIISEELWEKCNQLLVTQTKKRRYFGRKASHLLSGYVACGCGTKMYIFHSSKVYTCKACKNRIAADDLDEIYYLQLESFLAGMSVSDYQRQTDGELEEKQTLLKAAQGEAQKLRKRIHELVNLRLDGELTKELFHELHKPLDERLHQLDQHIPELEAEIDFRNIQRLSSDTVLQEARDLYAQWPTFSFEQKRGIVEVITEKIVVASDEITITFSYLPPHKPPAAPSLNSGKRVPALKERGNMKAATLSKVPQAFKALDIPITPIHIAGAGWQPQLF